MLSEYGIPRFTKTQKGTFTLIPPGEQVTSNSVNVSVPSQVKAELVTEAVADVLMYVPAEFEIAVSIVDDVDVSTLSAKEIRSVDSSTVPL